MFLLSGTKGDTQNKRAPTLDLQDKLTVATMLERKAVGLDIQIPPQRPQHTNHIFMAPSATPKPDDPPGYIDPDLAGVIDPTGPDLPDMNIIESIMASLVDQDLLHGFISHKLLRFAITGSKGPGALAAGFPNVWQVIREGMDDEVPGWVKEPKASAFAAAALGRAAGPGMVVNLSGARPVGAAPA